MSTHALRPPPLRTSNTFDDDETFQNVSLNLLARYESLGMSAKQVLLATLISPKHRASFWEGLCVRLNRSNNSNHELIRALEQTFGKELHDLVQAESKDAAESAGAYSFYSNNPLAPRHTSVTTVPRRPSLPSQRLHQGGGGAAPVVPEQPEISMSSSSGSMSLGGKSQYSQHSSSSYTGNNNINRTKKPTPRRFFPDDCYSFFRSKRRVQNIDWKLAEAVKQVEHLQLDGMATSPAVTNNNNNSNNNNQYAYEPPSTSG